MTYQLKARLQRCLACWVWLFQRIALICLSCFSCHYITNPVVSDAMFAINQIFPAFILVSGAVILLYYVNIYLSGLGSALVCFSGFVKPLMLSSPLHMFVPTSREAASYVFALELFIYWHLRFDSIYNEACEHSCASGPQPLLLRPQRSCSQNLFRCNGLRRNLPL